MRSIFKQTKTRGFLVLTIFLCPILTIGQNEKTNFFVPDTENGKTFGQVANRLNQEFGLHFIFDGEAVKNTIVKGIFQKKHFFDLVEDMFPTYSNLRVNATTYLILDNSLRSRLIDDIGNPQVFVIPENAERFSGQLINRSDFSPIADAVVYIADGQRGTTTDAAGGFTIAIKSDYSYAEIQHPGVARQSIAVIRQKGGTSKNVTIELENRNNFLDELKVTARAIDANVSDHRSGIEKMSIQTIRQIPTFLGEIDPIRSITTLPGVTSSGDLGAGFNVRGGETSQNLILQDGGIIFNPSHLFGFFSSFNPDVIRSVELIKGNGPAAYGGRVASVLNLQTRNGDLNEYKASGGLGLVSSRLSLEGPLKKGRSSLLLSGRSSYSDWLIQKYDNIELQNSSSKFNDLTGKLFLSIGEKDALSVTGYRSYDSFRFNASSTYSWSTANVSGTYHKEFNEKLNADLTLARSDYKSGELNDDELFGFDNSNQVLVHSANFQLNNDFSERIQWYAGLSSNLYDLSPGISVPFGENSRWVPASIDVQKGFEAAAFAETSIEPTPRFGFDIGLRYANFNRLGPGNVYTLDYADRDGRLPSVSETKVYSRNELISTSGGFEPRFSLRYKFAESSSVKMGYSRTQQFIQQVSPTISPSPIDYWVLSSNNLKAQRSNQFSFGFFNNLADDKIETSVEAFYNKTFNALDYLEGVDLKLNPTYEQGLAQGLGKAYGVELYVKKRGGAVNGWVSYTWSRSWRIFKSEFEGQAINNGNPYPSTFDQPHQLSVVSNFELGGRSSLSGNITYNSGRPITIPISKYSYGGILSVNNYSERNSYRTPDYLRVDLSLTIKGKHLEDQLFSGDLIFSIFNVLGRKNAYAIWFDNTGQAFKTSVLGAAFPSVTYNFSIN